MSDIRSRCPYVLIFCAPLRFILRLPAFFAFQTRTAGRDNNFSALPLYGSRGAPRTQSQPPWSLQFLAAPYALRETSGALRLLSLAPFPRHAVGAIPPRPTLRCAPAADSLRTAGIRRFWRYRVPLDTPLRAALENSATWFSNTRCLPESTPGPTCRVPRNHAVRIGGWS